MTVSGGGGCLVGRVSLSVPMLDPDDMTADEVIPIKGVNVTLIGSGGSIEATTDADGLFVFDYLAPGTYKYCVAQEFTRDDGSRVQEFRITGGDGCGWAEILSGATDCEYVDEFTFTIESLGQVGDTDAQDRALFVNTAHSIAGIESALKDLATYPFSGPADSDGAAQPSGRTRRPAASQSSVRTGVTSALESLGVSGTLTDEDLAQLFPAERDATGDVTYRWSGPALTTRTSLRSNGKKTGAVQVSGTLARFQQRVRTSLNEMQTVLATLQPFNGHDVDPATLATQKKIVLQTMQSIVDEPERPDGLRPLAVDLQFASLLVDKIVVERDGTVKDGNLGVLEHLLGISDALINDQDAETHVTEWNRVVDAALSARGAWDDYKNTSTTPQLRFGERLQELHTYFGALSEAVDDARAMLRTVRYTPQEQAAQKFPTSSSGDITTDDLLSMVEELADEIGPTYITDWKGRGIATLEGRATRLRDATKDLKEAKNPDGTPAFPFSSARVRGAFSDIERILKETADLCDRITQDMI